MISPAARQRLVRLYAATLLALGAAAYVSGSVTADICGAYASGRLGASAGESGRPLPRLC